MTKEPGSGDRFETSTLRISRRAVLGAFVAPILRKVTGATLTPFENANRYLASRMDDSHRTISVFRGLNNASNRFPARAKIFSEGAGDFLPPMDENADDPNRVGNSVIRCQWLPTSCGECWGGWVFNRGVTIGNTIVVNWGDFQNIGLDLSGTVSLTFRARAEASPVEVEFFCFGNPGEPNKISLPVKGLTNSWTTFTIPIPTDVLLNNVMTGFGWVCSGPTPQTFLLDSVEYQASRLNEPRFIVSYDLPRPVPPNLDLGRGTLERALAELGFALDSQLRSTSFLYDNSLAVMVFLVSGENKRADLIAEAMRGVFHRDRALDGVLRNAYSAGELWTVPDSQGRQFARLPGYWSTEEGKFFEDHYSVSLNTGNLAWAALALLAHANLRGNADSFTVSRAIADWVIANCMDTSAPDAGFWGGFEGWETTADGSGQTIPCATGKYSSWGQCRRTYVAVEHCIDLYPLFRRLYDATSDNIYRDSAQHARAFVERVWRLNGGRFFLAGTDENGVILPVTDSTEEATAHIPLDVHPWAVLAFRMDSAFLPSLDYIEQHHRVVTASGWGYGFKQSGNNCFGDLVWYEGTAHVATAYRMLGRTDKWSELLEQLSSVQLSTGGLLAASGDGLDTGFSLFSFYPPPPDPSASQNRCLDGAPWLYFARPHIGSSSWFAFCVSPQPVNPYWLGAPQDLK